MLYIITADEISPNKSANCSVQQKQFTFQSSASRLKGAGTTVEVLEKKPLKICRISQGVVKVMHTPLVSKDSISKSKEIGF